MYLSWPRTYHIDLDGLKLTYICVCLLSAGPKGVRTPPSLAETFSNIFLGVFFVYSRTPSGLLIIESIHSLLLHFHPVISDNLEQCKSVQSDYCQVL